MDEKEAKEDAESAEIDKPLKTAEFSTLSGSKPRMTSVAVSEKIRQWAATLQGDISGDDASKLRQEFIQYAEELEAELIESTFNV